MRLQQCESMTLDVVSLSCAHGLLQIWFYWSKSKLCCTDVRTMLGCDPVNYDEPCLGFTGDCAGACAARGR